MARVYFGRLFSIGGDPMIVPEKHWYCYIDRKPIGRSKAYQLICRLIGKKAARKLTYKDW